MKLRHVPFFSVSALFIILLYGCAILNPQRAMIGDTFSSGYPKINVKIDPKYRYLGHKNYMHKSECYSDSTRKSTTVSDIYLFVPKEAKDEMGSVIFISFIKIADPGWLFIGSTYSPAWLVYQNRYGEETFAGQSYDVCTHEIYFSPKWDKPLLDLLKSHGIPASGHYIARSYCRNASNNERLYVQYLEDFPATGLSADAKDDKLRADAKKQFLDDFERRASQAIEIVGTLK